MTALKKVQGINSLGLIYPLAGSETNNSSETPNCYQNLDMIALKRVNQFVMTSETTQT